MFKYPHQTPTRCQRCESIWSINIAFSINRGSLIVLSWHIVACFSTLMVWHVLWHLSLDMQHRQFQYSPTLAYSLKEQHHQNNSGAFHNVEEPKNEGRRTCRDNDCAISLNKRRKRCPGGRHIHSKIAQDVILGFWILLIHNGLSKGNRGSTNHIP